MVRGGGGGRAREVLNRLLQTVRGVGDVARTRQHGRGKRKEKMCFGRGRRI